jgi:hypothetical protein
MSHSPSPLHWPIAAHVSAIVYCKIIGQLSPELLLTNVLLDREALLPLALPQQLVNRDNTRRKAFYFRGQGGAELF